MSCLSRHIDVSAETQSQNYLHYKQSLVETAGSVESDIVAAVEALKSWPLSPEADYLTGSYRHLPAHLSHIALFLYQPTVLSKILLRQFDGV